MKLSILFFILVALLTPSCKWVADLNKKIESPQAKNETPLISSEEAKKLYLAPGNPSNAGAARDNFLLVNSAFAAGYNNAKGHANWVSWCVTKGDMGEAERQNDFRPDPALPGNFAEITTADYSSSGYERGHLCPSADRASAPALNSLTFLMTNIAPQTHDLNAGPWEKLERYTRAMARRSAALYIVAGGYGSKGKIKNKIDIPSNFWKVIVVNEGGGDISSVNENTRVIAVDMPNEAGILNKNWREYAVTVRSIEQKTGYDLLSNLPKKIQDALETKVDPQSEK
jgi:endonuclease G, mitochondrial